MTNQTKKTPGASPEEKPALTEGASYGNVLVRHRRLVAGLVAALKLGPDVQPVGTQLPTRDSAVRGLLDGNAALDGDSALFPVANGLDRDPQRGG